MSVFIFEKQRTNKDCAICTLAMFLGVPYEEVKITTEQMESILFGGMEREVEDAILLAHGYEVGKHYTRMHAAPWWATTGFVKNMLWGRRAIISVMSKNYRDATHAVYWDGEALYDPSTLLTHEWKEVEAIDFLMANERRTLDH